MPQINQWRRYDSGRQALMRKALERVAATSGISKGLRETVSKALH
jgi:aminopeptidase N